MGKRKDGDAYYRQSGNLAIAHLLSPSKGAGLSILCHAKAEDPAS